MINAFRKYLVGTGLHGETIFWQIDERKEVRTGNLIVFDPATGKRRKDRTPDWIHAILKKTAQVPETFELRQCFFGQHLLAASPSIPIAIVEAAKTAIVATICESAFPEMIWLASGGKHGLSIDKLERISVGQRILLYPDLDALELWENLATRARQRGMDVRVSTIVRDLATQLGLSGGVDIADCLLAIHAREVRKAEIVDDALAESIEERIAIMTIDGRLSEDAARAYVHATGRH